MRIGDGTATGVGVAPTAFCFLSSKAPLWTSLRFSDSDRKPDRRHSNNMNMVARLRPGVTMAEAQAQVDALNQASFTTDTFAKLVGDAGFFTVVRSAGARRRGDEAGALRSE